MQKINDFETITSDNQTNEVKILNGKSVVKGLCVGKIHVLHERPIIVEELCQDSQLELESFYTKVDALRKIMAVEIENVNDQAKEILEAQKLMLEDENFLDIVRSYIIQEKYCSAYAVICAGEKLALEFKHMDNEYMQARSEDVLQISKRLVDEIVGYRTVYEFTEDVILMANDYSPAQLVAMDKSHVKGLVANNGNISDHTSILASNYGLPYIIGIASSDEYDNTLAILNAEDGTLIINPDNKDMEKAKEYALEKQKLLNNIQVNTKMKVYANISNLDDLTKALELCADGIGLFRTEFLFMNRNSAPSEEEQYKTYRQVLENMGNKEVIIRTVDIGTDKSVSYLHMPEEENPALGLRGIRVSLWNKNLFKVQLRALLRAAVYGNACVMFPMITSVKEILAVRDEVISVVAALEEEKVDYKLPKIGIMVETPAAALCSNELGKYVDFFSIGTNDLTQYTLALDRQAQGLDFYYDPHHEAILTLVEMTVKGAKDNSIPVGICGQLGADKDIIPRFVRMGINEVSVSVAAIPDVREIVINVEKQMEVNRDESCSGNIITFSHIIKDKLGIHARPAGELTRIVKKYDCELKVVCGSKSAKGTSILEWMKLGASCGAKLDIMAGGNDAVEVINELKNYMEEKL